MSEKYLKALSRVKLYNSVFSFMGVIGFLVFCMYPVFLIFNELIGVYSVFIVLLLVLIIVLSIKWYIIKQINKKNDYLYKLSLKIHIEVDEMKIESSTAGSQYCFRGAHTFSLESKVVEFKNQSFETVVYECKFHDGSNVMFDYMRTIKQRGVYPQMEVNINPLNHNQYYIDSEAYMRKLGNALEM